MSEELVLIPGFANHELAWSHQIEHLSDLCDIRVFVMNNETTRSEMVKAVLKEAPTKFTLAGHSMGGWIAQAVAAAEPERVEKLILLNTWATPDPKMMFVKRQICEGLKQGQFEQILGQQLFSLVHHSRQQDPVLVQQLQTMISSFPVDVLVRQLEAMLQDYSSLHLHPAISAPTLIVHSSEDALFPLEHQALHEGIDRSQLSPIEGCGHASTLEKPEIITELMRSFIE